MPAANQANLDCANTSNTLAIICLLIYTFTALFKIDFNYYVHSFLFMLLCKDLFYLKFYLIIPCHYEPNIQTMVLYSGKQCTFLFYAIFIFITQADELLKFNSIIFEVYFTHLTECFTPKKKWNHTVFC